MNASKIEDELVGPYLGYTNYPRESIAVHARQLCEPNLFSSYFSWAKTPFRERFSTLRTYLLFNFMFSVIEFCAHETWWLEFWLRCALISAWRLICTSTKQEQNHGTNDRSEKRTTADYSENRSSASLKFHLAFFWILRRFCEMRLVCQVVFQ